MRNDNLTNFAYVGPEDGITQPPEVYMAYRPSSPTNTTPIQPGETTQLMNMQTGKYCRIAQLPANYPLNKPGSRPQRTPSSVSSAGSGRHLLQVPSSCITQGVLCDQDTIATASILTYTGTGMSYNGIPLVQSPNTNTLVLSADPACTVPGGDKLSFPPATLSFPANLTAAGVYSLQVTIELSALPPSRQASAFLAACTPDAQCMRLGQ